MTSRTTTTSPPVDTASPLDWLHVPPGARPGTSPGGRLETGPEALGVRPADVGLVGWQILLRDGVLRPVWGDLAAAAGSPVEPSLRAAAVRSLVPPRAVLGRAGAVWVHTGGTPPDRFDVLVGPRVRRPSPHPARVPHECPLPADDVVRLGDVQVTTVTRTALDVVRWTEPAGAAALLQRLVAHAGLVPPALLEVAARSADRRLEPRVRAALAAQSCLAATPAGLEPVMR